MKKMLTRLNLIDLLLILKLLNGVQTIYIHCHVKDATKTQGYEAVRGAECILLSNAGIFLEAAKSLTNSYGVAVIENVQPGYYQVRASRIGYYTLSESITIPENAESGRMIKQTLALSPRLSLQGNNDMYRIVLTWGSVPKDLDSYLMTPWSFSSSCKKGMVYYDHQKCTRQSETIDLDVDDTDMYGPETITLQGLQTNNFAYYVHIYTNGICWDKIRANVKVYQASTGGLVYNIDQPTCSESKMFFSAK